MTAGPFRAVAIGASAGAIKALSQILPALPADYALPVLIVVHVPPNRRNEMSTLFADKCSLPVREADDKEPILPGTIYLAPPDYHMLVEEHGALSLSTEQAVHFSRPSIDVLFESAADAYGPGLLALILTGANEDGAEGLRAVVEAGGTALVQDPATAFSPAMPLAALKACPGADALPIEGIVARLLAAGARPAVTRRALPRGSG